MDAAVKLTLNIRPNESGIGREALQAAQERLERALEEITRAIEPAEVVKALAAPDDAEFLVRVITTSGALGGSGTFQTDPLLAARIRGAYVRDRILAGADMLTAEQIADELGVRRQTVDNWRKTGKLLGLERARRGYLYPSWQVLDHKPVPGLARVLQVLGPNDPWRAYRFLASPEPRLEDRNPIDVLRTGDVEHVVAVAEIFGEQGAG